MKLSENALRQIAEFKNGNFKEFEDFKAETSPVILNRMVQITNNKEESEKQLLKVYDLLKQNINTLKYDYAFYQWAEKYIAQVAKNISPKQLQIPNPVKPAQLKQKVTPKTNKSLVKPITIALLATAVLGLLIWGVIALVTKLNRPDSSKDIYQSDCYTPNPQNIVLESPVDGYVNNMVIVSMIPDSDKKDADKIADKIDGKVIGSIKLLNQYQIEVDPRDKDDLQNLCDKVSEEDGVILAYIDDVYAVEDQSMNTNDPWTGTGKDASKGAKKKKQWWQTVVNLDSALLYQADFSKINIGVIDSGFNPNHEDLKLTVLNKSKNTPANHGTHVAGIIGATFNNKIGINGVVPDANLRCVGVSGINGNMVDNSKNRIEKDYIKFDKNYITSSENWDGIVACVENNCKLINLSRGLHRSNYAENNDIEGYKRDAKNLGTIAILNIWSLRNYGYDFIVIQSAGNDASEAKYSGTFAYIDNETIKIAFGIINDTMKKSNVEDTVTIDDIYNSFIIVGAVTYGFEDFVLLSSTNYGDHIDVVAPGEKIFSTVYDKSDSKNYGYEGKDHNLYAMAQGTSMASPIVTGIAALVWSIDPTLTSGEVKDIIISTADIPVKPCYTKDKETYHMVNAEAAVLKAIELRNKKESNEPVETTRTTTVPAAEITHAYGEVVSTTNAIYYWKYSSSSFNKNAISQYASTSNNQLICRTEDGVETVIYEGPGWGTIALSKDLIYFNEAGGTDIIFACSVDYSGNNKKNYGNIEIRAITEDGTLIGTYDGNIYTDIKDDKSEPLISNARFLAYEDGYLYYQTSNTDGYKYDCNGTITVWRTDVKGENKEELCTTKPNMYDYSVGGPVGVQQFNVKGDDIYFSYGSSGGTGNSFQGGKVIHYNVSTKEYTVVAGGKKLVKANFKINEDGSVSILDNSRKEHYYEEDYSDVDYSVVNNVIYVWNYKTEELIAAFNSDEFSVFGKGIAVRISGDQYELGSNFIEWAEFDGKYAYVFISYFECDNPGHVDKWTTWTRKKSGLIRKDLTTNKVEVIYQFEG